MKTALFVLLAIAASAQDPAITAPQKHSISGTVRDAGTGAPLADADVYLNRGNAKAIEAETDSQGHFTLRDVEPGRHRITVTGKSQDGGRGFGAQTAKTVTLGNQDLTGVDFVLRPKGSISGTITDQNGEPVPDIMVILIAREYSLGALHYVFAGNTTTNDAGEYTLQNVEPGRGYLILAEKRTFNLSAMSESPEDPRLRRRAVVPTFYPGAPVPEGAQAIALRPGEHREAIDIRLQRSPSYCIDGTIDRVAAGGTLRFEIAARQPTSGASGNGAAFIVSPGGAPGPDGKIRVCDLAPGDYQLAAIQYPPGQDMPFYGTTDVTITDSDLHRFSLAPRTHVPLPAEVVWFGTAPDPAPGKLTVELTPLTRMTFGGELSKLTQTVPIAGQAAWDELLVDDYSIQVRGIPSSAYLKDITYGNRSILHQPLRIGAASGDPSLRIVLAADGGPISAKVTDKDGNPLADEYVVILPASSATEAALSAALVSIPTDQNGSCASSTLAPGKYFVAASAAPPDRTPESVARIWANRSRFQEVEIAPKSTIQVTLVPIPDLAPGN